MAEERATETRCGEIIIIIIIINDPIVFGFCVSADWFAND
jgi:hypothetical protein